MGKSNSPSTKERVFAAPNGPERSLVLRVTASNAFQKSPRLRELLQYLCRRTLEGRFEDLHEKSIGCHIFGRPESYHTQDDNIVRVSVSQLRKKLDLYFTGEGAAEPLVIEIPRGTYQPLFRPRQAATPSPAAGKTASLPPRVRPRLVRAIRLVVAGLTIALLAASVVLWNENRALRVELRPLDGYPASVRAFWQFLFNPSQKTDIVVADSGLAFVQDITGGTVFLDDYTNARHTEKVLGTPEGKQLEAVVKRLSSRQFTSAADIQLVVKITRLSRYLWRTGGIRLARSLETRDFSSHNLILLGSQRSNPWSELFEPQMNFVVRQDQNEGVPYIENRAPRAGERAIYRSQFQGASQKEAFAVLALLPNLGRTGHVLLIAGTEMEATEAAGEYLTNGTFCGGFLAQLGFGASREPAYFEAVVRSRRVGSVGVNPEVVAYRTISPLPQR